MVSDLEGTIIYLFIYWDRRPKQANAKQWIKNLEGTIIKVVEKAVVPERMNLDSL